MSAMSGYDFAIVGAGSAGCALARRLSEREDVRILLIEAGGEENHPHIADPTAYFNLWESEYSWRYESTPQEGTAGRCHRCPRGKVLGGSSSINGLVYFRGARLDYDGWARQGNAGWEWARIEPSFDEMERLLQPTELDDPNPLSRVFLDACLQTGHEAGEFDGGELIGAGWNRSTVREGERNSSYRAFLADVRDRPNLEILVEARAVRVRVDRRGAVSGVELLEGGSGTRLVEANEVILCAGTYNSPALLMHSGIGPTAELEALGLEPKLDLPVGRNLVDHVLLGVLYEANEPIPTGNANLTEATLFARSSPEVPASDLQISFNKEQHFADGSALKGPAFTIIPGITRPKSRGSVRLASGDPLAPPVIDPRHLAEEQDVRGLLRGIELAREIAAADALSPWRKREVAPGSEIEDEAGLREYIESACSSWYHGVGTCRMGIDGDSVVGPDLRVHGSSGLRVADASVMPEIVSCNTNGAATIIGWHAADLVLS
jgi:choline dehydrogenase-like flavoprotein